MTLGTHYKIGRKGGWERGGEKLGQGEGKWDRAGGKFRLGWREVWAGEPESVAGIGQEGGWYREGGQGGVWYGIL